MKPVPTTGESRRLPGTRPPPGPVLVMQAGYGWQTTVPLDRSRRWRRAASYMLKAYGCLLIPAQSYPAMKRQASRLRMPEGDGLVSNSDRSHPSRTLAEAHSFAVRMARSFDCFSEE
jgi:hypothetical protein